MSVPERPDESVEWAESPHAEVEEPEELRLYGWPYGFVPPSAAFNWLQRSVGRWIQWLEAKVDGHVHDGGSGSGSAPKVNPEKHIDWEENGYLQGLDFPAGKHKVVHRSTADGTRNKMEFETGILDAFSLHVTDEDRGGNQVAIKVEQESGESSPVLLRIASFLHEIGDLGFRAIFSGATVEAKDFRGENVFDVMVVVSQNGEVVDGYGRTGKFQPLGGGSYRIGRADSSTPSFVAHITAVDNQANSASLRWGPSPGDGWLIDFSAGEPSYFLYCEKRF